MAPSELDVSLYRSASRAGTDEHVLLLPEAKAAGERDYRLARVHRRIRHRVSDASEY